MDSTTKESLNDAVLKAWNDLEDVINAMTGSLEYEWEGEWREEIEALNTAHIRLLGAKKRLQIAELKDQ